MMEPEWIRAIHLQWFSAGEWTEYPVNISRGQTVEIQTNDGTNVEIRSLDGPEDSNWNFLHRFQIVVHPNADAEVSGVCLNLSMSPGLECVWKPLLSPKPDYVVGDKVFRSPAIILENDEHMIALIPNVDHIADNRVIPHVMDYETAGNKLIYGLSNYKETGHVYHVLSPEGCKIDQPITFEFDVLQLVKSNPFRRDFRSVEQLLWARFAQSRMLGHGKRLPVAEDLEKYVDYTYDWAFDRWKSVCWQEFELNQDTVGGVAFIIRARQKPGLGLENSWREPKSLWNQAWFCSLRSAYGYCMWGRKKGREDWCEYANLALHFALSAPQTNGLFPSYFEAGEDGSWKSGRWFMSAPRRPSEHEKYAHLLDASWTCYWLLRWYSDIQSDERILNYVRGYLETLLSLQLPNGSFPAWVEPDSLSVSEYLKESPESAVHVMLLCLAQEVMPDNRFLKAAQAALKFVDTQIVPYGRWEDFETYWSCSTQWEGKVYGEHDSRSGMYNQCNFGIYWTVEAAKELYKATGQSEYLEMGERVLAELSLYQAIWEPPYFPVPTLGGFGVMNSDDEWNDARQSLFALTYLDYFHLTGNETYKARAFWAMNASFYMMYCPENVQVKELYETVHPFLGEEDYGFMMENFNHHDGTSNRGLGEFTIFDWGNGAACSSLIQFLTRL